VELSPEYVPAYFLRATIYVNQQQYSKAIEDFSKVVELDPGNADAYFNRGLLYRSAGKKTEAINDFQQVLKLDTSDDLKNEAERYIKLYGGTITP
jgi:tetratricopeptide (TPR) repeat protein